MSGLEWIAAWAACALIITGILYLYDRRND